MADDRSSVNVEEIDVATLQDWMQSGRATARQIVEAYTARIEALDGNLRSVLEVNPDALAIADALDRERASGQVRGPLHGIPILLKDNIDTADQMETTAGSLALLGSRPARDATVAAQLRAGRRDPARQDEHERVGQLPLDPLVERLERARPAVPQPVRARPLAWRL